MVSMFHGIHGCAGKTEPECSTELAAHVLTITTAAQDYEHPAWERYDWAYREHGSTVETNSLARLQSNALWLYMLWQPTLTMVKLRLR